MKLLWTTLAAGLFLALCTLHGASGAAASPVAQVGPAQSASIPAMVFVEAPIVTSDGLTQRFPQGSRLVRMTPGEAPGSVLPLTPDFFAAADPQVSFDGGRILFSAERAKGDSWQIWEMAVDGSGLRQITHGAGDFLEPKYLPRNQIVYTFAGGSGGQRNSAVYVGRMDGTSAHPITFGPGNFQVETVLRSGRILVSAESPLGCRQRGKKRAHCSRCDRMDRGWRCFAMTATGEKIAAARSSWRMELSCFLKRLEAPRVDSWHPSGKGHCELPALPGRLRIMPPWNNLGMRR